MAERDSRGDGRHRVLWYTLDGDVSRADELLHDMGADGQVELVGCPHETFVSPTLGQMDGCEAVVGEFCPVRGKVVDESAAAGVRLHASMSIGLNHLDVEALSARHILVTNCPGYCAEDVATHAVALMLDLERKVTFSNRSVLSGGWDPKAGYALHRLSGQTLGLVFLGHIARAVMPMARGLGMRVVVWAPTKSEAQVAQAGAKKVDTLDELLAMSDVVSLHCPLIPQTQGLIGAHELDVMRPTAFLVNTARGELVDEEALADALESGTILGAGLDTLAHEAHDRNARLVGEPNCIVTPHAAYDSVEAADTLRRMALESICELLVEGRVPANAVNPEAYGR